MGDTALFEYRCVAGPMIIAVKNESERAHAVAEFEKIINREAVNGWEYVGIDEFQTSEPTGCFSNGQPKITIFKMLVFKRQKM